MFKKTVLFLLACVPVSIIYTMENGMVIELTQENSAHILQNSSKPVVIDFYATWCPPCKIMKPIFHELALELEENYTFVQADYDKLPELVKNFDVKSMPTFALVENGQLKGSFMGAMSKEAFIVKLEELANGVDLSTLTKEQLDARFFDAIQTNNIETAKQLVGLGVDVNEPLVGGNGLNALAFSLVVPGRLNMVKTLLELGANSDYILESGQRTMTIKELAKMVVDNASANLENAKRIQELLQVTTNVESSDCSTKECSGGVCTLE